MEKSKRSKIPMLNRFDTIAHIMPYYASTHKSFLLLSSLCSATRDKLDEFYGEFITLMAKYRMILEVSSDSHLRCLFLPCNLFIIDLRVETEKMFNEFIRFIKICEKSKGWYFNKNSMHSQIKFQNIIKFSFRLCYEYQGGHLTMIAISIIYCFIQTNLLKNSLNSESEISYFYFYFLSQRPSHIWFSTSKEFEVRRSRMWRRWKSMLNRNDKTLIPRIKPSINLFLLN